uniref:Saposin B-type domain-containing protein n=1 Tax=Pseudodiaptomus poplesia TaxID=213370 RepID=A0A0U2T7X7_9MAXI|nr:hypothetical protein [Pseudodiaptomus poplesia]
MQFTLLSLCFTLLFFKRAQGQVSCDECLSAIDSLQLHLMTDTSVGIQSGLLVLEMCPLTPNPQVCVDILPVHWQGIAAVAYPFVLQAQEICSTLQVCGRNNPAEERIWTCDYCTSAVSAVGDIMAMNEMISATVEYLKGDVYCGGAEDHQPDLCQDYVEMFMPLAMNILAGYTKQYAPGLCNSIIEENLCQVDT